MSNRGKGLTPFKKGASGNPNGRPKGTYGPKRRMRMILDTLSLEARTIIPNEFQLVKAMFPGLRDDITVDELMAAKIARLGLLSDGEMSIRAHKHLRDEAFGKVLEGAEFDDGDEQDTQIINVTIDKKYIAEILKNDKVE